jgi:hypothetical protein
MSRPTTLREVRPGEDTAGGPEGDRHDRHAPRPAPAVATRRAVTLVVLTLLVPGLAQYARGNRRVGLVALRIWAGAAGLALVVGLLWVLARGVVLTVFTLPTVLALLGVLVMAAGLLWPLLVVDAWRLGVDPAMPTRSRRWVAVLMVVGVLVTSVPVLGTGRRVWAAGDLIGSVFSSGRSSDASHGLSQ